MNQVERYFCDCGSHTKYHVMEVNVEGKVFFFVPLDVVLSQIMLTYCENFIEFLL